MTELNDQDWLTLRRRMTGALLQRWTLEGRFANLDELIARLHLLVDRGVLDKRDGLLSRVSVEPAIQARIDAERARVQSLAVDGFSPEQIRRLLDLADRAEE